MIEIYSRNKKKVFSVKVMFEIIIKHQVEAFLNFVRVPILITSKYLIIATMRTITFLKRFSLC